MAVAGASLVQFSVGSSGWIVPVAAALTLFGYGIGAIGRSVVVTSHDFRRYALTLSLETGVRALVALGLFMFAGSMSLSLAVGLVALGPLLGCLVLVGPTAQLWQDQRETPTSSSEPRGFFRLLGAAVLVALAVQLFLNGGPLIIRALGASRLEIGSLFAALALARIPAYIFQAATLTILPRFARHFSEGNWSTVRVETVSIARAILAFGGFALVGAAVFGSRAVDLFVGDGFMVSNGDLALLVAAVCVLLIAQTLTQALYAAKRHETLARGWLMGAGVLILASLFPAGAPLERFIAGFLLGVSTTAAYLAIRGLEAVRLRGEDQPK